MNREIKKQQLKQRMVSVDISGEDFQDTQRTQKKSHTYSKKKLRKRFKLFLTLLLLMVVAGFCFRYYQKHHQYIDYITIWEKELEYSEGSFVEYIDFASNVLRYSKDGASYLDNSGKAVWMQSYEMKTPIAVSSHEFVAVADLAGNQIYIFNQDGLQGIATTLLPIMKISISQKGVVAAVLEDVKSNQISLFKKDGTMLDISMKGFLDVDGQMGYPFDIGLSPDGTQLIGSYLYLSSGQIKNRVVFHNFSEVGKNISNRLVAGFEDFYENSLVAKVLFLTETYACTIADNNIVFYSLQNVLSPKPLQEYQLDEEIKSIFYSKEYVGMIIDSESGELPSRIDIYKNNGYKVLSKEFHFNYSNAEMDGDNIFLYGDNSCQIYNITGTLIFEYTFDFNITKMKSGRVWNRFIVISPNAIKEIELQ